MTNNFWVSTRYFTHFSFFQRGSIVPFVMDACGVIPSRRWDRTRFVADIRSEEQTSGYRSRLIGRCAFPNYRAKSFLIEETSSPSSFDLTYSVSKTCGLATSETAAWKSYVRNVPKIITPHHRNQGGGRIWYQMLEHITIFWNQVFSGKKTLTGKIFYTMGSCR